MQSIDLSKILADFIANAPYVALISYFLYNLWQEFKTERAQSALERGQMLVQLTLQIGYIQIIAKAMNITLPDKQQIVYENIEELRQLFGLENKPADSFVSKN